MIAMLLMIIVLVTQFADVTSSSAPSDERAALVALYNATNGHSWAKNDNWLDGDPCQNKWHGVTCYPDGSHILALALYRNSLNGSVPQSIGNLKRLLYL